MIIFHCFVLVENYQWEIIVYRISVSSNIASWTISHKNFDDVPSHVYREMFDGDFPTSYVVSNPRGYMIIPIVFSFYPITVYISNTKKGLGFEGFTCDRYFFQVFVL